MKTKLNQVKYHLRTYVFYMYTFPFMLISIITNFIQLCKTSDQSYVYSQIFIHVNVNLAEPTTKTFSIQISIITSPTYICLTWAWSICIKCDGSTHTHWLKAVYVIYCKTIQKPSAACASFCRHIRLMEDVWASSGFMCRYINGPQALTDSDGGVPIAAWPENGASEGSDSVTAPSTTISTISKLSLN